MLDSLDNSNLIIDKSRTKVPTKNQFDIVNDIYQRVLKDLPKLNKLDLYLGISPMNEDASFYISNQDYDSINKDTTIKYSKYPVGLIKIGKSIFEFTDPYHIDLIIAHELRHVYQYIMEWLQFEVSVNEYSGKTFDTTWFGDVIKQHDYKSYYHLPYEIDANEYAIEFCGGKDLFYQKGYKQGGFIQ